MRAFWPLFILSLAVPSAWAEPDDEHVKRLFKSENYTVTWGEVPTWDPEPEPRDHRHRRTDDTVLLRHRVVPAGLHAG